MTQLTLVDDTNGEFKHVILHYCRAFHHTYEDIIRKIGDDCQFTIFAPELAYDNMDFCQMSADGRELPDFANGVPYTYELFMKECVHGQAKKFAPLLESLEQSSPLIRKYGNTHPALLLQRPNVTVYLLKKSINPFVRDSGFFCEDKNIVRGNPLQRIEKNTTLDENVLAAQGFTFHKHLDWRYDEAGDTVVDGNTAFISTNYITFNQVERVWMESQFNAVLGSKRFQWISNGPAYHLDTYFSPVGKQTLVIADLYAGRKILADNGLQLSEAECAADVVSSLMHISFDERQRLLDKNARVRSATHTVFRMPTFSFMVNDFSFLLAPLNLLSTDTKLIVPEYAIPGYDRVKEIYSQIGAHVGKKVEYVDKLGAFQLRDAALRCLVGNAERIYRSS